MASVAGEGGEAGHYDRAHGWLQSVSPWICSERTDAHQVQKTKREKEESSSSESDDDGYNSDEKAEIRAIAKKMLRKKERLKILNSSYNRYAFEDDEKVPNGSLKMNLNITSLKNQ